LPIRVILPSSLSGLARISPIVLSPADIKAFRSMVGKRTVSINVSSERLGIGSNIIVAYAETEFDKAADGSWPY
jgi:hypothetical protein